MLICPFSKSWEKPTATQFLGSTRFWINGIESGNVFNLSKTFWDLDRKERFMNFSRNQSFRSSNVLEVLKKPHHVQEYERIFHEKSLLFDQPIP